MGVVNLDLMETDTECIYQSIYLYHLIVSMSHLLPNCFYKEEQVQLILVLRKIIKRTR